ncbi:hypothetical protein PRK78_005066 [Emydomyces testavorans]|uniref:RecA family profile 1 domain-containing protein n=1 Tax=Emydomyces testavorans TaxID=2070801 RepID=A0AAF0IK63_9EURO|nr:hypothetical protein PRK78_005066 [Emydomyces testavorans]
MTSEDTAQFSSPENPRWRSFEHTTFSKSDPISRNNGGNIPTGLPRLDAALARPAEVRPSPFGLSLSQADLCVGVDGGGSPAGVRRGEVTEIVGPRGSGKTVLGMSLAAEVLRSQQTVVWIDTAGPLCVSRLKAFLNGKNERVLAEGQSSPAVDKDNYIEGLLYFHSLSLAHLMSLVCHSPRDFPPRNTGLIVIDSISCLFAAEFPPRLPKRLRKGNLTRGQQSKLDKESRLYFNLIGSLVSDLRRLALQLNCAVVVINEMASRFTSSRKPMLHEVITGFTWDSGISTSILLYWQWLPWKMRQQMRMKSVRIAEVRKVGGTGFAERSPKRIVPFVVENSGLQEFLDEESIFIDLPAKQSTSSSGLQKRKLEETDGTPDRQRLKLEPRIEAASPDEDDEEILDPLPGANEEDYEVPDSESDFAADDIISIGSRTSPNQVDSEAELLLQDLDDDARY